MVAQGCWHGETACGARPCALAVIVVAGAIFFAACGGDPSSREHATIDKAAPSTTAVGLKDSLLPVRRFARIFDQTYVGNGIMPHSTTRHRELKGVPGCVGKRPGVAGGHQAGGAV